MSFGILESVVDFIYFGVSNHQDETDGEAITTGAHGKPLGLINKCILLLNINVGERALNLSLNLQDRTVT
jgi:hypothetical protein